MKTISKNMYRKGRQRKSFCSGNRMTFLMKLTDSSETCLTYFMLDLPDLQITVNLIGYYRVFGSLDRQN